LFLSILAFKAMYAYYILFNVSYMKKTLLFAVCALAISAAAQTENTALQQTEPANEKKEPVYSPTMNFAGFAHTFYSIAETENRGYTQGLSMRRLRLRPHGNITDNISYGMQIGMDRHSFRVLDYFVQFSLTGYARIKVGQFAPPAIRAGALSDKYFGTTRMTIVQRSMGTQRWASLTNSLAYRDLGIQADGFLLSKKLYYGVMLANPKAAQLFTPNTGDAKYKEIDNGIKTWGRMEAYLSNELAIGAFAGYRQHSNPVSGKADSVTAMLNYGGHIVYRSNTWRFFTEVYNMKITEAGKEDDIFSFFAEAGYVINRKIEPAVRYARFIPKSGEPDKEGVKAYDEYTAGINYYINKKVTLQANYAFRPEVMDGPDKEITNNFFVLNLQYVFADK
jgi:hypothetical protein